MNNPLKYVDPSGNFFWVPFAIAILKGMAIGAAMGAVMGGIMAAETGNNIMQGVLQGAVSGAVSGAFFGAAGYAISAVGIASKAAQVAIQVSAGATAGAVNASITGGNIEQAALIGGLSSGIGAAAGDNPVGHVLAGAVVGGVSAEIQGGDFAQGVILGAWTSAVSVCMRDAYRKMVRYDTTWESGGAAVKKDRFGMPVKGANNIGVQGKPVDPDSLFNEGGKVSRFANHIPGVNAVAGLHDYFQIGIDSNWGDTARTILNVPGMPVAAVITYGALMSDPMATFIYYTSPMVNHR
jgi:hypothetical protein